MLLYVNFYFFLLWNILFVWSIASLLGSVAILPTNYLLNFSDRTNGCTCFAL